MRDPDRIDIILNTLDYFRNRTLQMNDFIQALKLANKENKENRKRAAHNYSCKPSELQPYDNSAYLKLVGLMTGFFNSSIR